MDRSNYRLPYRHKKVRNKPLQTANRKYKLLYLLHNLKEATQVEQSIGSERRRWTKKGPSDEETYLLSLELVMQADV